MARASLYLSQDRHGTYHFRARIPERLRRHFDNKTEIKRSLRTDSRKEAVCLARAYRVELDKMIEELTAEEAREALGKLRAIPPFACARVIEAERPVAHDDGTIETISAKITRESMGSDEDSTRLRREALEQLREEGRDKIEQKRSAELHKAKLAMLASTVAASPAPTLLDKDLSSVSGPLFSEVAAQYQAAKQGGLDGRTVKDTMRDASLFIELMGDLPFGAIKSSDMRNFRELCRKLPVRGRAGKPQYRGVSVKELVGMDIPESDRTTNSNVNTFITSLSKLWTWAIKQDDIPVEKNPCDGVDKLPTPEKDPANKCFKPEELKLLFESGDYKRGFDKPSQYWCPLIALYSGARVNEIAQLYLEDIKEIDSKHGIYAFDINDYTPDKSVKAGKPRQVPIHPKLLELGFVHYVAELRAKGEQRLFPELRFSRDGYGQAVGESFRKYQRKCGVNEVKGRNMHGFRYTFQNALQDIDVLAEDIDQIVGHASDVKMRAIYRKAKSVKLLYEAIKGLDYGLSHPPFKHS